MATRSPKVRALEIRDFIVDRAAQGAGNISTLASGKFGISRQAAHRYLHALVGEGILQASGETRNRKYSLRALEEKAFKAKISPDLKEDVVWREQFLPLLRTVPKNVLRICEYGFTEILNNAIDHSSGSAVTAEAALTQRDLEMRILDNGIGIFHKIQTELRLGHPREAILELSKGKLTTDPAHHTGEGIFFSLRAFDRFTILSGALSFSHTEPHDDWLIEDIVELRGTRVALKMALSSKRNLDETFNKFASEKDDYSFASTNVPVALARIGEENLVSRSQARRLLARFEKFKNVWLDFRGVDAIGQAFADEIFRVYAAEHPDVHLTWVHAAKRVEKMIKRAVAPV